MSISIKRTIFAHHFINPPSEGRDCSIDIVITDSSGKIILTKEAPGLQTRIMLTIPDASLIGITNSERTIIDEAIRDLILAFNINLSRTCL